MSLLRTIETNIARLVEGTFGRVFRSSVQPVELARRLVKEMDEHQQRTVRNVYVPNRYDVYLSRDDHRQLSPYAAALTSELSEYLAEHARRNSYALLTRPRVRLHLDRELGLGAFGIAVRMEQADGEEAEAPMDEAPMAPPAPERVETTSVQPVTPPPAAPAAPALAANSCGLFGGPDGPRALTGSRVRVGRGRVNDIVLQDASVSREHGELFATPTGWSVRDLDSTNGVSVNGTRVRERALELGDRVAFGSAELRFDRFDEED